MTVPTILLWLAIIVGLSAATAALYGRYKVLPAFLTGPAVCQLEAGGCAVLFRTKRASLLGLPNAFFGIVLYLLLAAGLILNWPVLFLLVAATPALLMSIFLGYSLITNHLECRICWAGHFANATIWLVLLFKLLTQGGY
ncbi:MAG: hypothetical protein C5B53_04875 [Candidatus Melainabacteria bacterium]|nr:MAG: hypothetical protein C5B53_04875 [Candidatus Melainabacteria bacterium]